MPEWKQWNGSKEQLDEMRNAKDGFILRGTEPAYEEEIIFHNISGLSCVDMQNITHYLICQPHPLSDMIGRWILTGQSVWWKDKYHLKRTGKCDRSFMPFLHPEYYEYSFNPFEN